MRPKRSNRGYVVVRYGSGAGYIAVKLRLFTGTVMVNVTRPKMKKLLENLRFMYECGMIRIYALTEESTVGFRASRLFFILEYEKYSG